MIVDKYIVIAGRKTNGWWKSTLTFRERLPKLSGNEIALRLRLDIPDAMFERPVFEAKMAVPKEAIPKTSITPEITDNIERIVKEQTGLNITVALVEHEEDNQEK